MKILGVTGTSGSGKSTFSKILNERDDVKVVDADQVSKDLSVPGTDYLQDVVNAFGQEILKEDGNLNRRALAHIIYNDEKEREKLNSITFPHITREIYERIKAFADPKIKYAVIDAPLLFEAGLDKVCDSVISLVATQELQVKRICQRDGLDEKTATARLSSQKPASFYIDNSDIVIMNTENTDLREEAKKVFEELERKENLERKDKVDEGRWF